MLTSHSMDSIGDVLGDEGRKALNACVKVKIYGRPQNIAKYHWETAWRRLDKCYAGGFPRLPLTFPGWLTREHLRCLLLPDPTELDEDGRPKDRICDIIEIHDALENFDKILFVEKYPKAGPRSDALKELIDKRRADIETEYQKAILSLHVTDVMSSSSCRLTENFLLASCVSYTNMETTKVLFESLGIACKLSVAKRECEEATADPDARHIYSWLVAQRRVRDCYAGNFAGDVTFLKFKPKCNPNELYNIIDIHDAVVHYDKASFFERNVFGYDNHNQPKKSDCYDDEQWTRFGRERELIQREFIEATFYPDKVVTEYSQRQAELRVKNCYEHFPQDTEIFPIKRNENGMPQTTPTYNIFDIHKAVEFYDQKKLIQKYPEDEGPGSDELKKLIEKHNSELKKEYWEAKRGLRRYSQGDAEKRVKDCLLNKYSRQKKDIFSTKEDETEEPNINTYDIFDIHKMLLLLEKKSKIPVVYVGRMNRSSQSLKDCKLRKSVEANKDSVRKEYQKARNKLGKYSQGEAQRRARDCFAGAFLKDTDIFSNKEEEKCGIPKTHQTFNIFDIKDAKDHFDSKKLRDKYLDKKDPNSKRRNKLVDDERKRIEEEYAEATAKVEIEHGSGFIVHDHFIITNKHVIEDAENNKTKEICVSNAAIHGELVCEVAYTDAVKDLALLYCPELNLKQNGICPLQLSNQPLLPGMQVFSFGYPMSHTGEAGLFVNGHVSGSKETYSGHSMIVLNCALNSGNSGGPILCFIGGQLKVVGVATQKHFKEILTLDEREKIEKIRESLQTSTISSISDSDIKNASVCRKSPFYETNPCQTPINLLTLKLYDALETHSQFNLSNALPGHCVVEFIQETFSKYKGDGKEELLEIVKWSEDHANILPFGHHFASDCCIQ